MAKRRTQDSDFIIGSEDDPIGLTSAFAPVKGPQSVMYDKNDDAIGLTGAFEPITDVDEPRAWDEAGKWKDFDWNASYSTDDDAADDDAVAAPVVEATAKAGAVTPASTGSMAAVGTAAASGKATAGSSSDSSSSGGSKRGRHAAPDASMSPRMQKSRKTRRVLIVLVVLLIIALAALAVYSVRTFADSQQEAAQQAQEQVVAPKQDVTEASDNAGAAPARLADVPKLTTLLGKTSDEAVANLGRGAIVTANRAVDEEGNPIKTSLNVSLTEEPMDSKTGAPTVYLGLNQDGRVVQVGYSASASALGFGSLSFIDAVNNEHVIEKTLGKIGVTVPEGSVVLPADKSAYSTYSDDGTTVVRERCSFEGDTEVEGLPCTWSSVLSYDYTTQVVTGDLSDTVRIIYSYVTQK